ncbi:MAG: hypothetical protein ACR2L1_02555, partial [Pyrinomonadaceae bacterium]
ERKQKFAVSLKINGEEQAKLSRLEKIFKEYPQFAERRKKISIDDVRIEKNEKSEHYEARMNLPLSRFGRFLPVCREFLTGRYNRFSNGFLSAMKDLFEKW